jgi:hypothetical protein
MRDNSDLASAGAGAASFNDGESCDSATARIDAVRAGARPFWISVKRAWSRICGALDRSRVCGTLAGRLPHVAAGMRPDVDPHSKEAEGWDTEKPRRISRRA